MWNLIKLEMKKNKIKKELVGITIANLAVLLSIFIGTLTILNTKVMGIDISGFSQNLIISIISVLFAIYGSILFITMYTEQFDLSTIKNNFILPYSRKKLIISKLLLSIIFTLIAIILTYIIQNTAIIALNNIFQKYESLSNINIIKGIPMLIVGLISSIGTILFSSIVSFFNKSTALNVTISIFLCFSIIAPLISSEDIILIGNLTYFMKLFLSLIFLIATALVFNVALKREVTKDIPV